jgi:preprotein translocase subunit SecF
MKTLQIISKRKIWFAVAILITGACVASLAMWKLNFGLDFTGGSLMEISFENRPAVSEAQKVVDDQKITDAVIQEAGEKNMVLRFKVIGEEEHQELLGAFKEKFGAVTEEKFDSIGPVIGAELQKKSFMALILVLIGIAVYVAFAFRKVSYPVESWKYGVVTLISLAHDVLLPIGIFAVLGKFLNVEVGSAFVAAILTVLGYSVNDTIVVFDRVRENLLHKSGDEKFEDLVNRSVNETMARSINTTFTTLLALVAVFFFGGESLKMFALALIIGVTAGAYSSIFIASPLLVTWFKHGQK